MTDSIPELLAAATDEDIAKRFHYTYERLAPQYGYETRPETATAWTHLPEANRELMIATVKSVRSALVNSANEREAVVKAARAVVETWGSSWDCSRTPGHPHMDAVTGALADALAQLDARLPRKDS